MLLLILTLAGHAKTADPCEDRWAEVWVESQPAALECAYAWVVCPTIAVSVENVSCDFDVEASLTGPAVDEGGLAAIGGNWESSILTDTSETYTIRFWPADDPKTVATATFIIEERGEVSDTGGGNDSCGCATTGLGPGWLMAIPLVGSRRRRHRDRK